MNVADLIFRGHVMIAGIKVAVVLHYGHIAASLAVNAQRMLHAEKRPHRLVKKLDKNLADIVAHPFIEDRVQKLAISRRRYRAFVHRIVWIAGLFDQRQKL